MIAPLISAFFSLDGGATSAYRWLQIDPPLTIVVDAAGRPHLGIDPSFQSLAIAAGSGIVLAQSPGLCQISADTACIAFRVDPPSAPGPTEHGTGAWATAGSHLYFVVPDGSGSGFAWARAALETTW